MKKFVKPEKSCENCRYFLQHFTSGNTCYFAVNCGHCKNRTNRENKKMKEITPYSTCELWEDIQIRKAERKKAIKETLETMAEKLNEIAMILKEDED